MRQVELVMGEKQLKIEARRLLGKVFVVEV